MLAPCATLVPTGAPEVVPLPFTLFAFSTGREDRGPLTVPGAAACWKRCSMKEERGRVADMSRVPAAILRLQPASA